MAITSSICLADLLETPIAKLRIFFYNTLMRTVLAITLSTVLLGTVVPAFAQEDTGAPVVSIEDAIYNDFLNNYGAPNGRRTARRAAEQEAEARARFESQLQSQTSSSVAPNAPASPDLTTLPDNGQVQTPDGEILTLSASELRMLSRLQRAEAEGTVSGLHGGAPLYPSGMGTIVGIIALALAVCGTYVWAGRMEKKAMEAEVIRGW